jgi:GGDEF domain-containing protein
MSDIHHFLQKALEDRGTLVAICWTPQNGLTEYSLTVQCNPRGGDAEWKMYGGSGTRAEILWTYVSCDVLLVHNLVQTSCGDGFSTLEMQPVGQEASGTWRDSGSGQNTLYEMEAFDLQQFNKRKESQGKLPAEPDLRTSGPAVKQPDAAVVKNDATDNKTAAAAAAGEDKSFSPPPFQKTGAKPAGVNLPLREHAPAVPKRRSSALAGDIAQVQMPTLLQSILMAKMTGKLRIESNQRHADVFFKDGVAVHASTHDTMGEEGIFEILSWKDGEFYFESGVETPERTIKQKMDNLLLQGMQIIDNATFLRNSGLRPEAVMHRLHQNLSESQFESMVQQGAPIPLGAQKSFYQAIGDGTTVSQLLEKVKLPRSRWILLMCNMLRCELITLGSSSSKTSDRPALEPKSIDKRAIQNVMMSLRRPETGLFTYPAFLYFLEQEYFRGYRSASPISIIVFNMRINSSNANVKEPLPLAAVSEAVRRISRAKRHVDMMAHYETFDYAMLLPNTKVSGAAVFANRILKTLKEEPLMPGLDPERLSIAFGVASIPEDCVDLSLLLSAAEVAKNAALNNANPIVLYRDIK